LSAGGLFHQVLLDSQTSMREILLLPKKLHMAIYSRESATEMA
jgi:hypothetical protein